ncbi:serine hydrolase domain-containing protein [Aquimarina latercula]|uniref:serine hydrolase domain-containing protein n=1 Tax=Aquimarina latercula TaxID=987 RepID=UPI00041BCCD5|nr:serine hydrolase domain-containing protein [Aquimarina latercula]
MKTIYIKCILIIILIQPILINAQSIRSIDSEKITSILESHFDKKNPGGAFAIIQKGKVIFKKTMGLANVEYQIPIADTTVFNIASNSKQMTSLLTLILQEEGKLSINDDIRDYLPELKELPYKVTIKQLMNHTHGLPNVDELAQIKGIRKMTYEEVITMLFNIRQFNFKPGNDYQYNNTGFVLLSKIITNVGEKTFQEQLKEKVFNPFGMDYSQAVDNYNQVIPHKAYSYTSIENNIINNSVKISTIGSSGVYASLNDLIVWAKNFTRKNSKYQKHFKRMQKETILNNNRVIEYGLGIQFENYKGIDIVFHGGGTEGYRSYILHAPKHDLSLIFLSNAGGLSGYEIIYDSLEILLKDNLINKKEPSYKGDLSSYEGIYELNASTYYNIWEEDNSLYFGTHGTSEKTMLPKTGKNVFDFVLPYSKLIFNEDSLDLRFLDFSFRAKKVDLPTIDNSNIDLTKYIGIYKNKDHNAIYELTIIDNKLIVKHTINGTFSLNIYSESMMNVINSYFGKIDFIFNSEGEVLGFNLSRQNLVGQFFEKKD